MRHGLYAVRDKCARAFLPPFCLPQDEMAVREFAHACSMPDHKFHVHARDFSLYKVAEYDDDSGVVTPHSEPFFLIAASQCVTAKLPNGESVEADK